MSQNEATGWHQARWAEADGLHGSLHQVRLEGVARKTIFKEEDHPLLPVLVVLGNTQAVRASEELHCSGDRAEGQALLSHHPTLMGLPSRLPPAPPWGRASGEQLEGHPSPAESHSSCWKG